MKQMAKLAQALVHGPRLLILDEPTNGLDPRARQRMVRLIRDIRDSGRMHILLCSHLLRDVEETCEEVLILKQGRIVHYSNLEAERSTNKRFVELETSSDGADFAEAIAQHACACTAVGARRYKMVLPEGFELREIYRVAAERDLPLRRLSYRRDTLEDIFLKAMEGVPKREESRLGAQT
jgi:ABC-2 type transport system ATP-binding protein